MNLILFLLLALTASRTGLVQCEDDKDETGTEEDESTPEATNGKENPENHEGADGSGDGETQDLGSPPNIDPVNEEIESTTGTKSDTDEADPNSVIMIIIPLVLTLFIIAVIVCGVMIYRRGRKQEADDPYLDHEDHEKVPMPMFDDDIPSVMELEMEDLENWISKDGGKKVDTGQI